MMNASIQTNRNKRNKPPHQTYLSALISLSNLLATFPLPPAASSLNSKIRLPTKNDQVSLTCLTVFEFCAANASTVGKKAASSADARFASWAPVHLDSRWRAGFGAPDWSSGEVDVIGGVGGRGRVRGTWILGMDGCFDVTGGFVVVVVVVVVIVVLS